ncbi:MAG TPA: hypothetical protein VFG72_11645 [Marmoricola sp.]|nr:hypothetical protein [Marmoricola sp.]
MTITTTTLTRSAGVAAAMAGMLFIGIQIGHPHLDVSSITTTEVKIRGSLKVLMGALGLVGVTGMYLRQVRQTGVLGLVGYLVLGACYLVIMSTSFVAVSVLPSLADTNPGFVSDAIAVGTSRPATGDVGLLETAFQVQGFTYLAGGLLFGIALYRARVLARWAAALLAVGGTVSVALSQMPDAFYRLLAFPNGIAMIGLGYSLWRVARADAAVPSTVVSSSLAPR